MVDFQEQKQIVHGRLSPSAAAILVTPAALDPAPSEEIPLNPLPPRPGRILWGRAALAACVVVAIGLASPARAVGDELQRQAKDLRARYASQLEELARWCDGKGLGEQAAKTRRWLTPRNPSKLYVAELPQTIGPPALAEGASAEVVEWNDRFLILRRQQALALEKLARQAVGRDRQSLAFDLVMAAVREDPDHEGIRRLLGFQKFKGNWCTLFEKEKLQRNYVWHEKFGWLPRSSVAKYEQGMRFNQNRWISAADNARLHEKIENGWDVETEHYVVRTNHSLESGVALGDKLEQLYRVWKQLFVRYFATEQQVRELFNPKSRKRIETPRFRVVYLRTKDEYVRALQPSFPQIEISTGIYVESTRRTYFYAGEQDDQRTLFHEATHQLFHESRPVARNVAARGNFWIIEGIAMYMESLHREDGFHVLGGFDDVRMVARACVCCATTSTFPSPNSAPWGCMRCKRTPASAPSIVRRPE